MRARMRDFLQRAVEIVRARFGGPVSYASLPLEDVDWSCSTSSLRTPPTAPPRPANATPSSCAPSWSRGVRRGSRRDHGVRLRRAPRGGRRGRLGDWKNVWDDNARAVGLKGMTCGPERAGDLPARAARRLRVGGDRRRVRLHLRALRPSAPRRTGRRSRHGECRRGEGARRSGRRARQALPDMPWEPKVAFDTLAELYDAG